MGGGPNLTISLARAVLARVRSWHFDASGPDCGGWIGGVQVGGRPRGVSAPPTAPSAHGPSRPACAPRRYVRRPTSRESWPSACRMARAYLTDDLLTPRSLASCRSVGSFPSWPSPTLSE